MEKIRIPSPSAILDPQPAASSAGRSKAPVSTQNASPAQTATSWTTKKPKQSKSRNGCITCKAKRLKCDETKPTCIQCKKRNVECGGYKKDFKWRSFGGSNVPGSSAPPKAAKERSSPSARNAGLYTERQAESQIHRNETSRSLPQKSLSSPIHSRRSSQLVGKRDFSLSLDQLLGYSHPGSFTDDVFISPSTDFTPTEQSPWLSHMPPTSDTDRKAGMGQVPLGGLQENEEFSFEALLEGDGDEIEEIIRLPNQGMESRNLRFAGEYPTPPTEPSFMPSGLLGEPAFSLANPEMLVLHFDRSTCGILSVKDGIHENPWRTLVWPLAKDTPALYHAIFALAAFHASKDNPSLRVHGVDHMRQSITSMVQDIQGMRTDAALATSLALAFADTWDQHTRSCIQHLRGAKALVSQVVRLGLQGGIQGIDLSRIRFLYNTWLYMDVIARLTSREEHGDQGMEIPALQFPQSTVHEIDPLMGCATTLFPLINRVARLIQRTRKTESNSISLISEAIELKQLVEQWEPPDWFEPPEDPTSEVQHSIQTAHAYRWATLLYLHQAVPEMPSEPTSDLAKRVLILLATVPPSSRTTIIQMYPLLVAGCEAEQDEDRDWVLRRWSAIQTRLMLGSIDRCIEVVREVWARRDASENTQGQPCRQQGSGTGNSRSTVGQVSGRNRVFYTGRSPITPSRRSSAVSPLENIEFDKTVRGRLHWVQVMQEWGWEVFLG
ncbi:fungal-specific transcription factor domain-containing protein [Aspergillus egyptiacus]|nr:fungal-specific transcription factor domain-containing protein [Aspergillus egyptiacus]